MCSNANYKYKNHSNANYKYKNHSNANYKYQNHSNANYKYQNHSKCLSQSNQDTTASAPGSTCKMTRLKAPRAKMILPKAVPLQR